MRLTDEEKDTHESRNNKDNATTNTPTKGLQ